jgi:flagellar biosynthesis protein FlhB
MADDSKTQAPTGKKLDDARAKGDVPMAPEMRHAIMFAAAAVVTASMGATALARATPLLVGLWRRADDFHLVPSNAQGFATGLMFATAMAIAPLMALLFAFAVLTGFSQGLPTLSWSRVGLKWSKISPIAGFGRLFGLQSIVEFSKTLLKLLAVITIALLVVAPQAVGLVQLMDTDPGAIGTTAAGIVTAMVKAVLILVGAIAVFDLLYQRFSFFKRMRMSLQEVKDEAKQSEGDPAIKARIRSIGIQRARRRMMAAVPGASVIITNPTHFAVALKYDHGAMMAPIVVAKGADAVAFKIREVARAANVPIVESPVLARAIYAGVEIDHPIPTEHYAAVAEIIGYILRVARAR